MGKWTPEYIDAILCAKVKSLVSGAILRSGLENGEPKISYEHFVEDLDTGDSFIASVIECLVKEVADRHHRPDRECRRLSDRTIKTLRSLITASRIAPPERSARRGRFGLTDFLASHQEEANTEDDEHAFTHMLERAEEDMSPEMSAEGAQLNSELYDAYSSSGPSSAPVFSFRRPSSPIPFPSADDDAPRPARTSRIIPSSSSRMATGAQLSRQSSFRRPSRRAADFNEHSNRRRAAMRSVLNRLEESRDHAHSRAFASSSSSAASRDRAARRFFSEMPRERDPADIWTDLDWDSSEERLSSMLPMYTDYMEGHHRDHEAETSDERTITSSSRRAARMTPPVFDTDFSDDSLTPVGRGARRPLETMLSRHASPVPENRDPSSLPRREASNSSTPGPDISYPTPESGDNESENRDSV